MSVCVRFPRKFALLLLKDSVNYYLLLFLLRWVGHLGIVLHHGLELWLQLVEDPVEQLIIVLCPHNAMPTLHPSQREFVLIELFLQQARFFCCNPKGIQLLALCFRVCCFHLGVEPSAEIHSAFGFVEQRELLGRENLAVSLACASLPLTPVGC